MDNSINEYDIQTAPIDINTSGNNTVISAPSQGYLAIDFLSLFAIDASTVTLYDGASTARSGGYTLAAQQALTFENVTKHRKGFIKISDGNAFVVNLGGATQVVGMVTYRIVGG